MNRPAEPNCPAIPSKSRRRRLHAGAIMVTLALIPVAGKSITQVSDGLSAGHTPGSNTIYYFSAATGVDNYVGGVNALAVGQQNSVSGLEGNFAAGNQNQINGYANGAIGYQNVLGGGVRNSLAWGSGNYIADQVAYATAGGANNNVYATNGQALGTQLTNNSFGSLVVGWYNVPDAEAARAGWRGQDSLFVVGNGSDSANRANALVVTKDGMTTLNVPARGGISMGQFNVQ